MFVKTEGGRRRQFVLCKNQGEGGGGGISWGWRCRLVETAQSGGGSRWRESSPPSILEIDFRRTSGGRNPYKKKVVFFRALPK